MVEDLGGDTSRVFALKEGETVWFTREKAYPGEEVETKNIYVDAYGVGDIGNIVLRDRKTLSSEGMVFVFLVVDSHGQLLTRPKIISRGFVYEKEEEQLYGEAVKIAESTLKPRGGALPEMNKIKRNVIRDLEEFFLKKKGRKPLIVVEAVQI